MRTAPGSLGVPFLGALRSWSRSVAPLASLSSRLGHTFKLARAVGRYPCTWDLFSVWSQTTAPVGARRGAVRPAKSDTPGAEARARPDLLRTVRRHRRPRAHEARAADKPEELREGPGVLLRPVHSASLAQSAIPQAHTPLSPGHSGHGVGVQRGRAVAEAAQAGEQRLPPRDPGRHHRHIRAGGGAPGAPLCSRRPCVP